MAKSSSIETVIIKSEVTLTSGTQMGFLNVSLVNGANNGWDVLSVHMMVDSDISANTDASVGAVVRRTTSTPANDIEDAVSQDVIALATVMSSAQTASSSSGPLGGDMHVMADNVVLTNLQFIVATIDGETVTGDVVVYFVVELMPVDVSQSRLVGILTERP